MFDKILKPALLVAAAFLLWIALGIREKGRYIFFRDNESGLITVCDSSTGNVFKAEGTIEIRTVNAKTILHQMNLDDRVKSK